MENGRTAITHYFVKSFEYRPIGCELTADVHFFPQWFYWLWSNEMVSIHERKSQLFGGWIYLPAVGSWRQVPLVSWGDTLVPVMNVTTVCSFIT